MIGVEEIRAGLHGHMDSIVAADEITSNIRDVLWALAQSNDVEIEALMAAANSWAALLVGHSKSVQAASGEGFVSGFLVACRVMAARAEV